MKARTLSERQQSMGYLQSPLEAFSGFLQLQQSVKNNWARYWKKEKVNSPPDYLKSSHPTHNNLLKLHLEHHFSTSIRAEN